MKINKYIKQPNNSIILKNWIGDIHYIDSYQFDILKPKNLSIDDLAYMILSSDSPKWEKALSHLRDSIVGLFGLKTGMISESQKTHSALTQYKPGDKIVFFPVIDRSESEIVMALNDKHLGFRVSLLMQNVQSSDLYSVYMTTIVQFHNIWGRIYFFPVKPFHKIIVKQSLKRFLKQHKELIPLHS